MGVFKTAIGGLVAAFVAHAFQFPRLPAHSTVNFTECYPETPAARSGIVECARVLVGKIKQLKLLGGLMT